VFECVSTRSQFLATHALYLSEWYLRHNGRHIPGTDEWSLNMFVEMKVALKNAQKQILKENKGEKSAAFQLMLIAKGIIQLCSLRGREAIETIRKVHMIIDRNQGPESEMLRKYVFPTEVTIFAMMGDKKNAKKSMKLWKRFGEKKGTRIKQIELLIKKMEHTQDVKVEKTLRRCSNLECGKVESTPREFNVCGMCKIAVFWHSLPQ
jgi:hypothetical protein